MKATDPDLRAAAGDVARHPSLWATAARAGARHLPRRGRSAGPWLRFRLETAYGDGAAAPSGADLVTWLRWARRWPGGR